ncbi:MAG: GNAT family N-acetyltransferase [Gemmatimonadota bacterium]
MDDTTVASTIRIEPMREADWPAVAEVYRQGIESGHATFETEVPAPQVWDAGHLRAGRLVARERLGRLAGEWRDVILLERRSGSVGVD